jgi:hypothetical protein
VRGVQPGAPHTFGVPPPPHVCPCGHVPQSIAPPHPSAMEPHVAPACWHVRGVHGLLTQTLFWHACPFGHGPQSRMPPQPLL